jgi:hypothetical protein
VQIVNGYMCATSCDVAAAKTGHDPKNPHDDPVKAAALAEQKALATGKPVDAVAGASSATAGFGEEAVRFGGQLAGLSAVSNGAATPSQLIDRLA